MAIPKFGSYDGFPVRWLGWEAWIYDRSNVWRETNAGDVAAQGNLLSEREFHQIFGPLPPLPPSAFHSGVE